MNALSKNQLKNLAAYRLQKRCDEDEVFVVEGVKMCNEALMSDFTIRTLCGTAEYINSVNDKLTRCGEIYEVTAEQLERLSNQRTPNKVWMIVERKTENGEWRTENGERRTENGERKTENGERRTENGERLTENGERRTENRERLTLALDGLQDPGNMGTIMRIADWYGIRHIVCSRDTVSCYNPKVVQATMGAIFRTKIDYCDLAEWLDEAANKGYATYAAMLDGEPYQTATLEQPAALVIGNEGKGISPNVAANVQHKLTIPNIGGTCESLNAAVATALLCAEFYR